MKKFNFIICIIIFISCTTKKPDKKLSSKLEFKVLSILSDTITIEVPNDLHITKPKLYSETIYFDTLLINRDTTKYLSIVVHDFKMYNSNSSTDVLPLLNGIASNYYATDSTLIKKVELKGNTNVGYLERMYKKDGKRGIFAAIVFYLKDGKRVEIFLNISSQDFGYDDMNKVLSSLRIIE